MDNNVEITEFQHSDVESLVSDDEDNEDLARRLNASYYSQDQSGKNDNRTSGLDLDRIGVDMFGGNVFCGNEIAENPYHGRRDRMELNRIIADAIAANAARQVSPDSPSVSNSSEASIEASIDAPEPSQQSSSGPNRIIEAFIDAPESSQQSGSGTNRMNETQLLTQILRTVNYPQSSAVLRLESLMTNARPTGRSDSELTNLLLSVITNPLDELQWNRLLVEALPVPPTSTHRQPRPTPAANTTSRDAHINSGRINYSVTRQQLINSMLTSHSLAMQQLVNSAPYGPPLISGAMAVGNGAVAIGPGAMAVGNNAIAMGPNARALGDNVVAIGSNITTASRPSN